MKPLKEQVVTDIINNQLTKWLFENNSITREFTFKTFVEAFSFMTNVALEVEKVDHHPDWCNSYNKVKITLTNHKAKGVTQIDIELAQTIDSIFNK